jgi:hypothetical protein
MMMTILNDSKSRNESFISDKNFFSAELEHCRNIENIWSRRRSETGEFCVEFPPSSSLAVSDVMMPLSLPSGHCYQC